MKAGIPKETRDEETRVSATPDIVRELIKLGLQVCVESSAGDRAGYMDEDYEKAGAEVCGNAAALACDIVLKLNPPSGDEVARMKKGALLVSFLEPYSGQQTAERLAHAGIDALGMESIPRTSRAQSMDALSSQANIGGYRAVIEAARNLNRFFPLMMTSAGSAKPAKVAVLGAGVAGLQAIATARRLGAKVEAYDVRAAVREQIESLGAKFIDVSIEEEGSGSGGYAKELSEESKKKQQAQLTEKLKGFDVIITTANIPGRKAPVLVTDEAVKGMRKGSVIVDMAAANGGNCSLTEANRTVEKFGIVLVGITNYPALMPADASNFYGRNLLNLLKLVVKKSQDKVGNVEVTLDLNLEDDIIAGSLVTHQGQIRTNH